MEACALHVATGVREACAQCDRPGPGCAALRPCRRAHRPACADPLTLSPPRAQIIQVNLTSEDFRPIAPGAEVEFTYSVRWAPTATPFARRFERYLDYNFFEHQARGAGGAAAAIGPAL